MVEVLVFAVMPRLIRMSSSPSCMKVPNHHESVRKRKRRNRVAAMNLVDDPNISCFQVAG